MKTIFRFCCIPCRRICSPKRAVLFVLFLSIMLIWDLFLQTEMELKERRTEQVGGWRTEPTKVKTTKDSLRSFGKGFSHLRPKVIKLSPQLPISNFVETKDDIQCLKQGTKKIQDNKCICNDGWFEKSCNVPESIHFTQQIQIDFLEFRSTARRIVYAVPFNHEFAMLEAVLNDLYDLVDVFIIMESSYTAFGIPKPIRLLPWLHKGYLKKFHDKIMYLYLDHFPRGGRKHGHVADSYLRAFLGKRGMPFIKNLADDDLLLVFDMDEIPSRDSLIFLKVHNRYPEPFGFRFRWSAFGYFWKHRHYSQVPAGCTIGMLRKVYNNDSNLVRDVHHGVTKNRGNAFLKYRQTSLVRVWFLGEVGHFAGWHCSSCFRLKGIQIKFMSAQNADWPRWGSIPEKMKLKNLRKMVREGRWFDGIPLNNRAVAKMADPKFDDFYAPPYIMKHPEKFKYLLTNIYLDDNGGDDDNEEEDELDKGATEKKQVQQPTIVLHNSGRGLPLSNNATRLSTWLRTLYLCLFITLYFIYNPSRLL